MRMAITSPDFGANFSTMDCARGPGMWLRRAKSECAFGGGGSMATVQKHNGDESQLSGFQGPSSNRLAKFVICSAGMLPVEAGDMSPIAPGRKRPLDPRTNPGKSVRGCI